MKLNHINLVVSNVKGAITLFETHFGFTCHEMKGDNAIAILKGTDDFTLVLMGGKADDIQYPKAFHIGFMLSGEEEVNRCFESLKDSGINLEKSPAKIRDTFGFYFTFDNLMIEVGYSNSTNSLT
jgi:catechol 2,3-dioxygenase-like lactoylglutathione lyase family enzyme